ncbi:MAG: hypothetical protein NC417_11300 [Candidatus Gastranaerophilales bacterium]|nr:hypothetical protein [Candidatus Gastranaerophilales bacterium]
MSFTFHGTYFTYKDQQIPLSSTSLLLDGRMCDAELEGHPYVYNDLKKAVKAIGEGDLSSTVTVYIAPYVYWVHDPDGTDVAQREEGYDAPYGMVIRCDSLKLVGLSEKPDQVVLAGNRGMSHGAIGNYTLFFFQVRDLEVKNLTMGNYCSIDLDYDLNPELSRKKRTATITQAQLAKQSGDKLSARNCRFVSRLNLFPISGGRRCLYENCHFESTDDALNGRAVYVGCDFDFYGNRPLYDAQGSGAVFLGCRFRGCVKEHSIEQMQYFTKEGGPVTVVDCEYLEEAGMLRGIAWTKYPSPSLKCYQYHMRYNGKPVVVGGEDAAETVCLDNRELLGGYRLETEGKVVYNTYNLLRGEDDWDPMGVKEAALRAGKGQMATLLTVETSAGEIISGEESAILQARAYYFYGEQKQDVRINFVLEEADRPYVRLTDRGDGSCLAEGTNEEDGKRSVVIRALTPEGLEGAVTLVIHPQSVDAPVFEKRPAVVSAGNGRYRVDYELTPKVCADRSIISWYRCDNAEGRDAVLVAVSRAEQPMWEYILTRGDVGYYLMAQVRPRRARSREGESAVAVSGQRITLGELDVKWQSERERSLVTDFSTLSTAFQGRVLPGFWTVDVYRPDADGPVTWGGTASGSDEEPWKYGKTGNGSVGLGLYQSVLGARLLYTPVEGVYGDMELRLKVDPAKTAGQGFGCAGQYMDVCIKFDTISLTGYGVRIIRTTEASDGVRFVPVCYDHGAIRELSEGVLTSCYITGCEITLAAKGRLLTIHGDSEVIKGTRGKPQYASAVDLTVAIEENSFGGIAIWHRGSPGTGGWQNTTMLHTLEVKW